MERSKPGHDNKVLEGDRSGSEGLIGNKRSGDFGWIPQRVVICDARFVLELLDELSILIKTFSTMTKTVFILGAGASKKAGAPLMDEFLDVAEGRWKVGAAGKSEESFKSVFKGIAALQDVHSKARLDFNNIEA